MCKSSRVADIEDYLTTAQVAELAHRTVTTVNRWVADGRLTPARKLPGNTGAYLFRLDDVEAALTESGSAA